MSEESPPVMKLSGEIGLRNIAGLRDLLLAALAAPEPLLLDGAAVESADIGTLQVLLSAQKSALAAGRPMRLTTPASGPLGLMLRAAGVFGPDGRPRLDEAATWTLSASEAA